MSLRTLSLVLALPLILMITAQPVLFGAELTINSQAVSIPMNDIEFNKTLSDLSTLTSALSILLPGMLLFEHQDPPWILPIGYSAAIGTAYASKEMMKHMIDAERPAPYVAYYMGTPKLEHDSFPSGHTMLSFAASSFTAVAYAKGFPDSTLRIPCTLVSFGLSASTGLLRFASGAHHVADIITGAVLGSLIGGISAYMIY